MILAGPPIGPGIAGNDRFPYTEHGPGTSPVAPPWPGTAHQAHAAMCYVKPGGAAVAEVTTLLGLPRQSC
jgi:hypothetical protein